VLGGNKSRKLEYVVADALAQRATTLVTVGAAQSNHARMTAAAARLAGLGCVLVLTADGPDPEVQGNLLLDEMLDAQVMFVPPGPPVGPNPHEDACVARVMSSLQQQGQRPYFIIGGASNPLGVLGYVDAMGELKNQLDSLGSSPTRLYYAAGSRGTQAGVVLGSRVHDASWTPHGIAVSPGDPDKTTRAVALAQGAAELMSHPCRLRPEDVITHQQYYGAGYAIPTEEADEAVRLVAQTEAILLDPVYTGKAMSGLIDHVKRREISGSETVVFLHTGGIPALFAQAGRLATRTV
jgi:1-aminocyclopropane-1-carboxylate deaminase/D-cysteine desulfhydrase-like pyridoxal-dependent ACC family enzyme